MRSSAVCEAELFLLFPTCFRAFPFLARKYAKRLAEIAGDVGEARLRDDVAHSVANYVKLVPRLCRHTGGPFEVVYSFAMLHYSPLIFLELVQRQLLVGCVWNVTGVSFVEDPG